MGTFQLQLSEAVALQGSRMGVWVADRGSRALVCFDAGSGEERSRIALSELPATLATAASFLAAAFDSGVIAAFDISSGAPLWRSAAGSSKVLLRSGGEHIWAAEKDGPAILSFDRSGPVSRVPAENMQMFAAIEDSVFWLSKDGMLAAWRVSESKLDTAPLSSAGAVGSMTACANALWLSVENGLVLVDQRSLAVHTTLHAPEGPVPHLFCEDGKIVGGLNGVFVLNPMAETPTHALPIKPASPLRGIAATPTTVWALESARPVVHVADLR